MFQSAIVLSQKYNISMQSQYLGWESGQTGGNIMNALSDTCQCASSSILLGIVGPTLSSEAQQIANFGERIGLPVISYSATDPQLSDRNSYPTFYRTVPSDNEAAVALVKLFLKFNWTSCVVVYQNDLFGTNGINAINNAFINQGLAILKFIIFDIATLTFREDLKSSLVNSPTRIVILWVSVSYASTIIQNALDNGVLGPKFTWISSTSISLTSFNSTYYSNLIGMLTVEPVTGSVVGATINQTLLNAAYDVWKEYEPETFPSSVKVNPYALFAFDAAWVLIQSLEQLCLQMNHSCLTTNGSSYCFDRYFVNSNQLLNIINSMKFLGISGPIKFTSNSTDRMDGSYYYVQNIQSTSTGIGFAPVLEYLDPGDWNTYPGSNVIVWPGNSLIPPTGRVLLDSVTVRIGVIATPVYTIVNGGSTSNLTGYAIDLIELLRSQLNFIPDIQLAPDNQTYAGLIQAVADGVYDMVVGDVTVTAARRELVDFSNSIFDNALQLMVRKTYTSAPDPLSFLKPFSLNLWITSLFSWVFASVLFCFFERDENDILANRTFFSQIAMSLWYCLGHCIGHGVDFHVRTSSGRLLTAALYLLSLVLLASYTANLASDLTILKTQNILSGIDDLKNGKIPPNRIGIRNHKSLLHQNLCYQIRAKYVSDHFLNRQQLHRDNCLDSHIPQ
ncbi:unnamed protein product [Adineta ricciae]|uniref:Ionotropic glutamate receptor C-terminal domain-containing protein n=1 Tax=Adineta ricciae TaxID=249248 RepID=A0A815M461_ADIRI|nr:unnamed protein product [Adineta ricciae]